MKLPRSRARVDCGGTDFALKMDRSSVTRATGGYANLRPYVYALEDIPGFASTTASGEYQTATYVGVLSKQRTRR